MLYADIIVDISHESLDKTYQYKIPDRLQNQVQLGQPVMITFGYRRLTGYVVGLSNEPKIEEHRMKEIEDVVEKGIPIESRMIVLAHWMKENFGGTMNDALRTVLSVKKVVRPVEKSWISLKVDDSTAEELLKQYAKKHYVAKARLMKELLTYQPVPKEMVTGKLNVSAATLKALEQQGVITTTVEEVYRTTGRSMDGNSSRVVLNENQQKISDLICREFTSGKRGTYLIHGVTGSGKTGVYMQVIETIVSAGKQVIV